MLHLVVNVRGDLDQWLYCRITIVDVQFVLGYLAASIVHRLEELESHGVLGGGDQDRGCGTVWNLSSLDVRDIGEITPSILVLDSHLEAKR